jgi:hypothetical protein
MAQYRAMHAAQRPWLYAALFGMPIPVARLLVYGVVGLVRWNKARLPAGLGLGLPNGQDIKD